MNTRGHSGSGSGSSSSSSVDLIDKRLCEFISAEVTHDILDTHVRFGTIKKGIM